MPSKKYTAEQRAERERKKYKEQRKSSFPLLPILFIIIIVGIVGAYFLFSGDGVTVTDNVKKNIAPVSQEDFTVLAKNSTDFEISVLENDADQNNDELNITSITNPTHGTAELISGVIYYTPEVNFSGVDSLQYTISDGQYESTSKVHLIVAEDNPIAIMETSMGTVAFELYMDKAPITAKNFIDLAKIGYYDELIFHRVISGFMIQGGDPNGDGTGGHAAEYHSGLGNPTDPETWSIPDEFDDDLKHDSAGIVSMANAGANTGGSQFFITVAPASWLDGVHSVFGKVLDGQAVVNAISEVDTDSDDRPLEEVQINSIRIENE